MKLLVTGSEGQIGRHIVADLASAHQLVRMDARELRAPLAEGQAFCQGDLTDPAVCARAVEGVEAIVHLAAVPHARPPDAYQRNTQGTWNLLTAAARAGVQRVAFASSINVYGQGAYKIGQRVHHPPYLPIDADVPPRPEDAYGLSKQANEQAMRGFSDACGMRTYCFRLAGVWWPDQTGGYRPHRIHAHWGPHPSRCIDPWNYVDIRDVAAAFRRFVEMPTPPPFGISYLVADDTTRPEPTMDLLAQYIPEWVPLAGDRLPGHRPWFSNGDAKRDLGWQPAHTWRSGAAVQT